MNFTNKMYNRDSHQPSLPSVPAPSIAPQPSLYSLTLDQFQSRSTAKDFGSMNMDELLKNIWTADENQSMAVTLAASDTGTSSRPFETLQRQGSLTLPRTLSQKTVDEVWRDLVGAGQLPVGASSTQQRQPTFGEVTLEEFLVRAGVVREELPVRPIAENANSVPQQPQIGSFSPSLVMNNKVDRVGPFGVDVRSSRGGGFVGIGDAGMSSGLMPAVGGMSGGGYRLPISSPVGHLQCDRAGKTAGDLSSVSPVPYVFHSGMRGRKSSDMEKVIERRHRRMIKNRESAARSRARKQAYTMELEAEVAALKEEKANLEKKQAAMMQIHKNQVEEIINGIKKRCLRRTETSPW